MKSSEPKNDGGWIHQHQFELKPEHCETPMGISVTIPDESFTVQELLDRYQRGQSLMTAQVYYPEDEANHDHEDLEEVRRMDIADRQELAEAHKQFIDYANEELAKRQKIAEEKARLESAKKTIEQAEANAQLKKKKLQQKARTNDEA